MWRKCKCATEWEGFWICDKCDNAFYWKILGWQKDNVKRFYCDRCKQKIEENDL